MHRPKIERAGTEPGPFDFNPGDDRLSHAVSRAVPWALEGLTTVFEMGTGVTPPVWPPENCLKAAVSVQQSAISFERVNA